MVKRKALVTGCCGFIGSNLVHRLIADGWAVDGVDDMSSGNLAFLEPLNVRTIPANLLYFYEKKEQQDTPDVLMIQSDFAHENILSRIKTGMYDVIFHLAAEPRVSYSVERPVETTETNILKTVGLFYYAVGNVDKVVFSSSAAVYGEISGDFGKLPVSESFSSLPKSPYALQKKVCEDFAKLFHELYGLNVICLRYFNVYGPRQLGESPYSTVISAWCHKIKNNEPLRLDGDGEQTRDMVFVDDIVNANVLASEMNTPVDGTAINVATGVTYSNNEILARFIDRFGDVSITHAPERSGDIRHISAAVSAADELLDYSSKTSLDEGLEKTWNWWGI